MADDGVTEGQRAREQGRKDILAIDGATKAEKTFFDDALKAERIYSGQVSSRSDTDSLWPDRFDFNILYSNVETIVPAIINSPPSPDIRRRFNDSDPVAKDVAEILERSIRVQIDDSRLQVEMEKMAQDGFLAGRGLIRLRFKSEETQREQDEIIDEARDDVSGETEFGDDGKPASIRNERSVPSQGSPYAGMDSPEGEGAGGVTGERICFEAVSWRDYRHGPAKRWEDRPWEAFRHSIPRDDFYEFADADLYSSQSQPEDKLGESDADIDVWEFWDRKKKEVRFIEYDTGKVLKRVPDPLGLYCFFPTCIPVQPVEINGKLMPINPFSIYVKLAEELDIVTRRIFIITDQMKVRGWYPGSAGDLGNMLEAGDTDFVPIADAEMWAANGGLQNAVQFWPIEKFAMALRELYVSREQTKQAIYEITGISDIIRGNAKATETATAQQIKTQWGSLRIQKMQRMMERAARDLFVMMAEIIPSKFSAKTLQDMTGIQLIPTEQDMTPPPPPVSSGDPQRDQQAQAEWEKATKAQEAKVQHMEGVNALLNERLQTYYRIDVESDSTVRADLTRQKAEVAEFLQGAGAYWSAVAPLVAQGQLSAEVAAEIFASNSRMFNLGKSVEDAIDKMIADAKAKAQQPPPPNPEMVKAQAEQQKLQMTAQIEQARAQSEQAKAQAQIETQRAKVDGDMAKTRADIDAKQIDANIKMATAEQQLEIQRQEHALEMRKIDAEIEKIKAATASAVITSQAKTELAERNQSFKESQASKEATE